MERDEAWKLAWQKVAAEKNLDAACGPDAGWEKLDDDGKVAMNIRYLELIGSH